MQLADRTVMEETAAGKKLCPGFVRSVWVDSGSFPQLFVIVIWHLLLIEVVKEKSRFLFLRWKTLDRRN